MSNVSLPHRFASIIRVSCKLVLIKYLSVWKLIIKSTCLRVSQVSKIENRCVKGCNFFGEVLGIHGLVKNPFLQDLQSTELMELLVEVIAVE